jgi:quercetin dioxygenase-like cupin family protein
MPFEFMQKGAKSETFEFADRFMLKEGEFFIVPKGVEHLPYANEEAHVLLFEPKEVINTGNTLSEKTVEKPEWI